MYHAIGDASGPGELRAPAAGHFWTSGADSVATALASLMNKDADAAERVIQETVELDRGHANVLAELLAHVATDRAAITWLLPLTSVCRYLDRIGDHIRSLAGEVIYVVRAEHVRHPAV